MKFLEQFEKYNYKSLLHENVAKAFQMDISYFWDEQNKKPEELCDIYISDRGDEMFILLFGDKKNIHSLCNEWDNKVSVFVAFGSENRKVLRKIKYNVIEIILCKNKDIDREEESSLNITRKIILPYKIDDDGSVEIPDEEAVEIPFYMIPTSDFSLNKKQVEALEKCMPEKELEVLFQENKSGRGNRKTFESKTYEKIEEWLKHVYQERQSK